jgi:hypothetical protein
MFKSFWNNAPLPRMNLQRTDNMLNSGDYEVGR